MNQGASKVYGVALRYGGHFNRLLSVSSMAKVSTTMNAPVLLYPRGNMFNLLSTQRTSLGGIIHEGKSFAENPTTGFTIESLQVLSQSEPQALSLSPLVKPETLEASSTLKKRRRKMNRHKYRKRRKRDRRRSKA